MVATADEESGWPPCGRLGALHGVFATGEREVYVSTAAEAALATRLRSRCMNFTVRLLPGLRI
jgi:hypothetical protein